jgi:hypothetical protein
MFTLALEKLKTRSAILQGLGFMSIFIVIYTVIDHNNLPYTEMSNRFGAYLVYTNIFMNLLMAILSAFLLLLSTANAELKGKESMGSNLSFVSVLFGILTYGCTPCVIAFFASLGIAFSVIALPLAGLPYKFISMGLLIIGLVWTYYELQYGKCKVKV